MSFQNKVNLTPAQGWHGDFASVNPRVSLLGKDGTFQVGATAIEAGSFVWTDEREGLIGNKGNASPIGFVGREWAGINLPDAREGNMEISPGTMVTVFSKGEFIIELPEMMSQVQQGEMVYASKETGKVVVSDDKNAVATNYKYAENAKGGDIVKISAWI